MRNAIWSLILLAAMCIGVFAQSQGPQPGPEAKKLAMFVGNWQYEGNAKPSPLGPAAKISGKQTGRLVGGGFAIEFTGEESGVFGGVKWGETDVYDSASKSSRYLGYQDDGSTWQGSSSFYRERAEVLGNAKRERRELPRARDYYVCARRQVVHAAERDFDGWKNLGPVV